MTTLVLVFKKIESKDKTKYGNFYLSPKAETIINESDIINVFLSISTTTIENIRKSSLKIQGGLSISKTIQEKDLLIFKIVMIMNDLNGVW